MDVVRGKVAAGVSKARIAREMGVSRATLYKYLGMDQREQGSQQGKTEIGRSDGCLIRDYIRGLEERLQSILEAPANTTRVIQLAGGTGQGKSVDRGMMEE